jgi:hypothetical protein
MWLTGRLAPDFKTIAEYRRSNGEGIRNVCRRFVMICRDLKLFTQAVVAIDGSKFKAVNSSLSIGGQKYGRRYHTDGLDPLWEPRPLILARFLPARHRCCPS